MLSASRHHKLKGLVLRTLIPKPLRLSSSPSFPPILSLPHSEDPQFYTSLLVSCCIELNRSIAYHPFDETPHRTHASRNCKVLHARILKLGFGLKGKLGNAIVDFYSKSGELGYAQRAFDRLEAQEGPAWNSILSAYSRCGSPEDVARSFVAMWNVGALPDQFGLAMVLSACARLMDLDFGKSAHCGAIKMGYESCPFCEGSLIDMYAKCNCVEDARQLFNGIANPDTISWTNMIAGYARVGVPEEALELFSRMRHLGCIPDQVTFVTAISACMSLGRLEDARVLFMYMPLPNAVAWNTIISGHAQNGHEAEALGFFREMRGNGVKPTRSTLGSVLSAAATLAAIDEGQQVHSEAIRLGLDSNVFVESSLISMYAKCCRIEDARKVFDMSDERNTVMWNAMLGGYVQNGCPEDVIEFYFEMKRLGFYADEFTFVSVFGACASLGCQDLGRQLHSFVVKNHFGSNLFVQNAIVDMYAKCGELDDAKRQFELISDKDSISWNVIIVGLVHNDDEEEALGVFQRMRLAAVAPDEVSFAAVISACSSLQALEQGKQIHCLSIKSSLSSTIYVGSSLIDLYAKFGELGSAKKVFQQMPEKSVVSRNALIAGHVQDKNEKEAFNLFKQMQLEGLEPSKFTFSSILAACTGPFGLMSGKQLHCNILKSGLLCDDDFIRASLLSMYLKFNALEDAHKFFLAMESKSMVLWTTMISGLSQNGCTDEALLMFHKMHNCNVPSDEATFVSVLKACSDLAALRDGREVHSLIICAGFISYEYTSSALIDMYSKCGDMRASLQVFEELENKIDIISWNSIIVGYAKNGYADEALRLFQQMQQSGLKPDDITFLGVLTACSHSGLVSEGRTFFDSMHKEYGMTPRVDHYACMIDLLGRGGYIKEAEELIDGLPFQPDGVIWATLLAACRIHGDVIRGKHAAEKLMELEPRNSSPYVLLSSICAASGDWGGAKMVREAMKGRGVRKSPGCSWIAVGEKTSVFVAGDKFHPDAVEIHETLKDLTVLMKKYGYAPECDLLLLEEELAVPLLTDHDRSGLLIAEI